jgi:hypothetical protein
MGLLRREVLTPVASWRQPHALATLCLAALMFTSALDAMLMAYKLRCDAVWAERANVDLSYGRRRAEVQRLIAEQNAFIEALRQAEDDTRIGVAAGQVRLESRDGAASDPTYPRSRF